MINRLYQGSQCSVKKGGGYVGALLLTYAAASVSVESGEVDPDASVPAPVTVIGGREAWTCAGLPVSTGALHARRLRAAVPGAVGGRDGGGAFSLSTLEGSTGETCHAIAAISESSADTEQNLVILLIGAVIGLGITLLVQAVIDSVAGSDSRKDDPATIESDQTGGKVEQPTDPMTGPSDAP